MYILGISCYYHDSAAVLIKDGQLLSAVEEERFSRIKHDSGFPSQAIRFCLDEAGISSQDLSYVVFYEKPFRKFERILKTIISTYPRSISLFRSAIREWMAKKLWIRAQISDILAIGQEKILFTPHHLSHAASAFYCSPFSDAAVLTVDGVGEWDSGTLSTADGTGIRLLRRMEFPHSLGMLYSTFTAFLGFTVNEGEYKVMGMAPYGQPVFSELIKDKIIQLNEDGSFRLDLSFFSFSYSSRNSFSRKFIKLFGPARSPNSDFIINKVPGNDKEQPATGLNQHYANLAASIQSVTEEIILRQVRFLHSLTGKEQLCLAGGVGLNSAANGRILREGPFKRIFIQPAAGDAGGALGAALLIWHEMLKKPRGFVMCHAYWGKGYSASEVEKFLKENNVPYRLIPKRETLLETVAAALASGKVVGWFQGRFEWGPRALGNRSILADPRRAEMKQVVNEKIKFREPFRPFAPVVPEEHYAEYFDNADAARDQLPLRFMLMVVPVLRGKQQLIPAVSHRETARAQIIRRDENPLYYDLVKTFGRITNIPVLLNTSFNLRGEPIVNSPENAYNTFVRSGLDLLVMENILIEKSGATA